MPNPDWENLAEFFDPDEFATKATVTRDGVAVAVVFGIFDDPTNVGELGEFELETAQPRFTCPENSVEAVLKGDVVAIEGKDFDVMQDPVLDGTGIATLVLGEPNVIYNAGL